MKKLGIALLVAATSASLLAGCAPHTADLSMPESSAQSKVSGSENAEIASPSFGHSRCKAALPGGFRRTFDPSGEYGTEYVHISQGENTSEKPSYSLTLNGDNTFSFGANVNGVRSDHYGNWYVKRDGSIILFYDEPTDTPPHNVYVSDCMYMELLPQGKIMFYDGMATIILSKTAPSAS